MATFAMMDINEFEAGMLDAVLEAFAGGDLLSRTQILELFGDDEELAAAIVDVLVGFNLVSASSTDAGLPAVIMRNSKTEPFLESGGFTGRLQQQDIQQEEEQQPAATPVAEIENILPEPEAATESVADEPEVTKPVGAALPDEETEAVEDAYTAAQPSTTKQAKEVIFEIEFPREDVMTEDLWDEPIRPHVKAENEVEEEEDIHEHLEDEEITPEASAQEEEPYEEEQIEEPAEQWVPEPEPLLPNAEEPILPQAAEIHEQIVAESKAEEQPVKKEQPAAQVQAPDNAEILQIEITQLREEQMRLKSKLREKDVMIQTMATHNEQLSKLKMFIWVLLGLMALLVIGLIFHSHK